MVQLGIKSSKISNQYYFLCFPTTSKLQKKSNCLKSNEISMRNKQILEKRKFNGCGINRFMTIFTEFNGKFY